MGSRTDDILEKCGAFGRYQLQQSVLVFLVSFMSGLHFSLPNFIFYEPKHRCALPGWENDTYEIQGPEHNDSINFLMKSGEDGCLVNSTRCSNYVYSLVPYPGQTVVTEFGLVCDKRYMATLTTTLLAVSFMIGAPACGVISDRIGRKWTVVGSMAVGAVFNCVLIFSLNIYMFMAVVMVIGGSIIGCYLISYVSSLEYCPPKRRPIVNLFSNVGIPLGAMTLSLIGYYQPNWKNMQIVIASLYAATCILYAMYVQYALLASNRSGNIWKASVQAILVACTCHVYLSSFDCSSKDMKAHATGICLYRGTPCIGAAGWRPCSNMCCQHDYHSLYYTIQPGTLPIVISNLKEQEKSAVREKLITIFKAPVLLKRVLAFFYLWGVCGLGLYGLRFSLRNLPGNLFMNNIYSASSELLRVIPVTLSRWTGRKPTTIFLLFFAAVALISNALMSAFPMDKGITFIDVGALNLAVYFMGQFAASSLFAFAYFWCSEVYPTSLRSSLGGLSSAMARIGSSLAPFLADMYKYVDTPLGSGIGPLIMGIAMVIGGFLVFILPETKNSNVPETIAQANTFKTSKDGEKIPMVEVASLDTLDGNIADTKFQ